MATFSIEVSVSAAREIEVLRPFDRGQVIDAIARNLRTEPTAVTKRRNLLHGARPRFEHVPPVWQLRVGAIRVFYDVDEEKRIVWIRAVRMKGRRTTQEIL